MFGESILTLFHAGNLDILNIHYMQKLILSEFYPEDLEELLIELFKYPIFEIEVLFQSA